MNGGEVTLARYYAKRAVKAQWRAAGLKPEYIEASELHRAANTYLDQHPAELIAKACAALERFAQKPKR
jgi:hypothetical protein